MKIGDLIFDADLGSSGIVLEIMDECPELGNLPVRECYYRVMYDDGRVEEVRDIEVQPLAGGCS
ncbi:MAG: hypothetical protein CMB52_05590 [Euryarchaeota archaeon]|nr:hypothetical protein [Euryarchaeota archaeon]|tara:strand:- start:11524 stop:11715 length:192 start_codon:yes stop_codon:yes gene_type:complete